MRSFESLRGQAAGAEASTRMQSEPRNNSRIISAERLRGFVPFALAEFGRDTAAAPLQQFDDKPLADPAERRSYEAGYEAGLEAGLSEGRQRGLEAAAASAAQSRREAEAIAGGTLSDRIEALSESLAARFEQIERHAADEVVTLALEVARQVLRSTLAVRPETILPVVHEALAGLFEDRAHLRLHLHPQDAELVRGALAERLDTRSCEVIVDPCITAGGCRIVTPRAEIDATLETRWRRTLAAIGRNSEGAIAAPTTDDLLADDLPLAGGRAPASTGGAW